MRICLLGEYNEDLDEGMRKSSYFINKELSKKHNILPLDIRNVLSISFWKCLKTFDPQIVHYLHGASFKSFLLLKIVSLYCRNTKTIISITHPYFSIFKYLIYFIKPDLTLIQSEKMEELFNALGCKTGFFATSGVDIEKFNPNLNKIKVKLREKYGINKEKFIILHIGSIKKGRNILLLEKLQKINNEDYQIIIIGAISTGIHQEILDHVEKAGCIVWIKYFEHIEEIYALSDCYVFPVILKKDILRRHVADSIEMPLSVLEAMSCNLPVISTRFGALPRVFDETNGLFYVDKEEDFINTIRRLKCADMKIKTREKVLQFSWDNIAKKLENIYSKIIGENSNEK